MTHPARALLINSLMIGAAVIGGAWVGSKIAGVPFTTDLLKPYIGQATSFSTLKKETGPYIPRSEAGAILVAQRAEENSDWGVTHAALETLEANMALPPMQQARLFLSAVAESDWATAQAMMKQHPGAIAESAPLVQMIAGIIEWSDGKTQEGLQRVAKVTYNPISQPVLPFVKGWMTRETPQLSLMEAAQDITFSSINMVRFFEATKQYDRADALMTKLQEADLNLRLRTWSLAYFKRRNMEAEVAKAQKKIDELTAGLPSGFWKEEQQRILVDADAHLKSDQIALAQTLIDGTDFLEANNASAIALLYVQLAGKLAPDLQAVSMTKGHIYEVQENWDNALESYREVPKDSPSYLIAQLRVANILAEAARFTEARAAYDQLTSTYSKDPEVWYEKAEFLRSYLQDYDAAIAAYDKAVTLFKGNIPEMYWSLFLARGLCYELTMRPEEAEKDYQQALDLQPDHPEALNTLAYAWAEKGKNLDEAAAMALKALQQDMDAPHIIDTLGWIYFKKGEIGKALPLLERASSMMAYDPTVNSHLGDVYAAIGRKREAIYMWKRALAAADNDRDRKALREKLGL